MGQVGGARTTEPLWPPKPKLFEITGPGSQGGLADDEVDVHVVVEHLGVRRRRDQPVLDRQQRGGGLERAGGAERMSGDALGRHDRDGAGTEHRGDRGGLGGVVERGRGAVGVHLLDVAGLEPGLGECEPHAGDRARRRRATGAVMWWASALLAPPRISPRIVAPRCDRVRPLLEDRARRRPRRARSRRDRRRTVG